MSNLTFISVVQSDPGLSDLMVQSIRRFKPQAQILIADFGHNHRLWEYGAKLIPLLPNAKIGSHRHAQGLNALFPMVQTEYCVVLDSDTALLSADWNPIHALTGCKKNGTQSDYYHMAFCVLRTADFKEIDFSPEPPKDVGWRVQSADVEPLTFINCKEGTGKVFSKNIQCDEFHDSQGRVIATHFGRGSNLSGKIQKTPMSHADQLAFWKTRVEELIGC